MKIMITEVYDAFKAAGAGEQKSRDAAQAIANYRDEIKDISSRVLLLSWMVGFNLTFTIGVLWKVFSL